MLVVLDGLRSLPDSLNAGFRHPAYADSAAPLTLNVGTISGGDWPSSVPPGVPCRHPLLVPHRLVDHGGAKACPHGPPRGDRRHAPMAARAPAHGAMARLPSGGLGRGSRLAGGRHPGRRHHGGDPRPCRQRTPVGHRGRPLLPRCAAIPAVYYGPSGEGQHGPDEWVDLASVARVTRVLARAALAWCSEEAPG
ncbi:hypothetical protein [Nostocoides sp.]